LRLQLKDFLFQSFDFLHVGRLQVGRSFRLSKRDRRVSGVGAGLRRARWDRRHSRLGELDTPEIGTGFGKFQINVAICGTETALAEHLSYDFFTGSFVRQKKQLAIGHGRGKADHSAIFEDQNRLRLFRK